MISSKSLASVSQFNQQPLVQNEQRILPLDRIVHDSYLIEIQYIDKEHDKSMREIYGIKENS